MTSIRKMWQLMEGVMVIGDVRVCRKVRKPSRGSQGDVKVVLFRYVYLL